jgi:uncharacterized membrane protein YjfL (UPF0719 family)
MTWMNVVGILVWTGAGAVLLIVLMALDSLATPYKDMTEIKKGNVAVTARFVMKLFAQGYILAASINTSNSLWEALLASASSFIILFLLEWIVRSLLRLTHDLRLDEGIQQGKIAYALVGGSLHVVGALIIAACL